MGKATSEDLRGLPAQESRNRVGKIVRIWAFFAHLSLDMPFRPPLSPHKTALKLIVKLS
jgi:hypothetical protein